MRILSQLLVLLSLVAAGFAQTSTPALDKPKLDQFFDRLIEKNKAMGNVVVARDGKVVYARSIGYGQIEGTVKTNLSAASRFRIGSITKMFTATLILQLVEDGQLKLTDTLDKFFPQVPNAQKITIGQVLVHRSGIHDSLLDRNLRSGSKTDPITKDEAVAVIAKGTSDFEPDTQYRYSNSGYFLLGLIVEKITGKSYAEALKQGITSRIGLNDTYPAMGSIDVSKNEALTYINFGTEWKPISETHPSRMFGGGFIVSTPNDLVKFIYALFELKLISQQSLALMKTIRDGNGLMEQFTFAGKTFYGHTGGADNYGAWLAYMPEEKLAVAYTTNAKVHPVKDIVSGVVDIYYNKPFQIPTFESVAISADVLDTYVGVYSNPEAPVKFTITRQGTTILFQPGTESPIPLEATAQDKFKNDAARLVIEFDASKNQMTIKRGTGQRVFTKEK